MVLEELIKAPVGVRLFATTLPWNYAERLKPWPAIDELADAYIRNRVIAEKSFDDCLHIAYGQ
jgi:hypothetical protein